MKLKLLFLIFLAQGILFGQNLESENYNKHTLRVKFKKEDRAELKQHMIATDGSIDKNICGVTSVDQLNKKHKVKKINQLYHCTRPSLVAKHERHEIDLWYEINVEDEVTEDLIEEYNNDDHIMIAEPIILSDRLGYTPNDPELAYNQWHIQNPTAFSDGDIRLIDAWDIETGDSDVIVAVIDGGVMFNHEDLADAMWVNEVEVNGIEGVDDDGNGVIDDIHGIAFTDNGTFSPIEPSEHGSHVAGILGAVNNNGLGGAGVAGGNGIEKGVRIMSCGLFTPDGFSYGSADRAFVYAADNGAVIANCSWGRDVHVAAYKDAIDYFVATAGTDDFGNQVGPMKGGLVVAGSGNENRSIEKFPAAYDNVIAVTGTEMDDRKYLAGNYGDWIDIAAPASTILSTGNSTTSDYTKLSGTSMASPQVSGVAALLVSKYKGQGITPAQIKEVLLNTADNIDDAQSDEDLIGQLGSGRLNAFKALSFELNFACDSDTPIGEVIALKKSGGDQKWVTVDSGSSNLIANGTVSNRELFLVESNPNGCVALKSLSTNKYIQVTGGNTGVAIKANGNAPGTWENFNWQSMGNGQVAFQSLFNNGWVQAAWNKNNTSLFPVGGAAGTWETFDFEVIEDDSCASQAPIGEVIALQKSGGDQKWITIASGSSNLIANGTVSNRELFSVESNPNGCISLKSLSTNKYIQVVGGNTEAAIRANGNAPGTWENFSWESMGNGEVAFQSIFNNGWVQAAWNQNNTTLYPKGGAAGTWETFNFTIVSNDLGQKDVFTAGFSLDKIVVYPNPTSDILKVEGFSNDETLNVYDIKGRVVLTKNVIGKQEIDLNLNNLSEGIYVVVVGESRETFVKQ